MTARTNTDEKTTIPTGQMGKGFQQGENQGYSGTSGSSLTDTPRAERDLNQEIGSDQSRERSLGQHDVRQSESDANNYNK